MTQARAERRLAAILAVDLVGYSRLVALDESAALTAWRDLRTSVLEPQVAAHGGRIVKTMGDGALVEFASAVDAVDCAVTVQAALDGAGPPPGLPDRLRLRIGINLGDIVIDGPDILGDGVNIAARLESHAPPGGVLISEAVHAQLPAKTRSGFTAAGALALKNIPIPVRAWRHGPDTADTARRTPATPDGSATDIPSLAVLPFANMSGDPDQAFFVDGLVEDIITTLSKLSGLRVIARNSTFVYKGRAVDVREVARDLGVRHVLEGSVRRAADRIRVTAQLLDATTGAHLWAERYDRSIEDIFAVQDEITLVLATEMQVTLTEGEQARLHYTTTGNVEAWTWWVRGLAHFRKPVTRENSAAALDCWRRALALDPDSAALNAMVGFKHYTDARFGWWDDRPTAIAKANAYAERALALDPDNPDANTTRSLALLIDGRFEAAAAHARAALRLAPGAADTAALACFVLAFAGFPDEAIGPGERALALSPSRPGWYHGILGNAYRLAGRTGEAIAAFEAFHAAAPGFGLVDLVITHALDGRPEDAAGAARRLTTHRPDFTVAAWTRTQLRADPERLEAEIAALKAAGLP
ncbi:MAG: adenylate/guanylate cyclase domain-containing protein [Azospirillaceae bacterium]